MNTTENHLKRIQEKLQHLIKQFATLQKENKALREDLEKMKEQSEESRTAADRLKQQVEILKYTDGTMDEREKKQFEKRLTGYLREIDRCITMLSR